MFRFLNSLSSAAGAAWCKAIHPDPMWPVNGEYQCRVCHRKFRVAWEQRSAAEPAPVRAAAPGAKSIAPATQSV